MTVTDIGELIKLFREFPFTVKIHGSICDASIAIITLEFYGLTQAPIHTVPECISRGELNVFTLTYWIDTYELLRLDTEPYKSVNGWINGVMAPTMRTLFCHSLAHGEYMDEKEYQYAEYVLEYYFYYVTMYPRIDSITSEGEVYKEHIGLDVTEETRVAMLSFFHMQKTKELYRTFGIEAVYWMNHIRDEMKTPKPVDNEAQLDEAMRLMMAVRAKAKMLSKSLENVEEDSMAALKKKMLLIGVKNKNR